VILQCLGLGFAEEAVLYESAGQTAELPRNRVCRH